MALRATLEEIAEVAERRRQCKAIWNLDDCITSLKELYELLTTMGHWPEKCIEDPPSKSWSEAELNTTEALRLGYTNRAIEVLTRLPYPTKELRYGGEEISLVAQSSSIIVTLATWRQAAFPVAHLMIQLMR